MSIPLSSQAQSPSANFDVPVSACINQQIELENTSSDASIYHWDFCPEDFVSEPTIVTDIAAPFSSARGLKMVVNEAEYFGFVLHQSSLYRLEFGTSPENTPAVVDLGDLGVLSNAEGIDIVQEGSNWIGFTGFGATSNGGNVYKLIWQDIEDDPSAFSLGNFGNNGRIRGLSIISDENQKALVLINNNKLTRIDFRDSFLNVIEPENVFDSGVLNDVSNPIDIATVKSGTDWYAAIASVNNKALPVFNLGSNVLLNEPTHVNTTFFPDLGVFLKLELVMEGANFYGLLSINNQPVKLMDFKGLEVTDVTEEITLDDTPVAYGLHALKLESRNYVFGARTNLSRMLFEADCANSGDFSVLAEPEITYFEEGNYPITLTAFSATGDSDVITKSIVVSPEMAPPIAYTIQNICQSSPIQFSNESTSSGLTYSWDFGDTSNSTEADPSHSYAAAGEYEVTLEVSDGTCENFTRQTITIYDEPVPNFSMPTSLICSNQILSITNNTTGDFGGNESWEWQIDGATVSTDRDLDFTFLDGGMKEVKLIASIPGCSAEYFENITVEEGPVPFFTVDNSCLGTLLEFDNTSTGQIDTYLWDFDNGFTSSLINPSFEYSAPGSYNVSLTVENAVGCITTFENTLEVFALPEVQFNNDLSCEQNITQFNDLSTVQGANIQQWQWDFGDPDSGDNTSSDQDPTHTFSRSGAFEVKLVTTSVFGCRDSLTQIVNVLASPRADFTFEGACIGEPVQFQDTSIPVEGQSITTYEWDIDGDFSNQRDPVVTLGGAGDYEVTLFATSENLCLGSITRTISIAQNPVFNIGVEDNCENEPVKFYDLTETNGDAIS
ncbi:MAG: PKD domain-containing protein, partial [Bacteroidota bacterium]